MAFTFLLGTEDGNTITTEAGDPILLYEFATENSISYGLTVDWDGDGELGDGHEEDNILKWTADRGRERLIGAPGSGFEPYRVGTLRVELDNSTGRYNPWNSSGALYGKLNSGGKMSFKAAIYSSTDAMGYTTYDIFTGYITDLTPIGWNDKTLLTCEDGLGLLKDKDISQIASASYDTTHEMIARVISLADYPYGSNLSTADPTTDYSLDVTYFDLSALDEIEQAAAAKLGSIAAEADGTLAYHSIYESDTATELTDSILLNKPVYRTPWEFARDGARFDVYSLIEHQSSVDFDYLSMFESKLYVPAGGTYLFESSARPVINPTYTTTDYPTGEDYGATFGGFLDTFIPVLYGSVDDDIKESTGLTDITSNFTVDYTYGVRTSVFELTNNSATNYYVYRITIPFDSAGGTPRQYSTEPYEFKYESGTPQFNSKEFVIKNNKYFHYLIERHYASPPPPAFAQPVGDIRNIEAKLQIQRIDRMANLLLDYLSTPDPNPIVQLEGRHDMQFTLDVERRVTYNSDLLNINKDYRIAGLRHETLSTTQGIRTTLYLYPVIPSST